MKRLMNNPRILLRLVILLLISNIALAAFHYYRSRSYGDRSPRSNEAIEAEMKKELGLTEKQAAEFRLLLRDNRDKLKVLGGDLRQSKKEYYSLLQRSPVPDSIVQARNSSIAEKQSALDRQMFSHFQQVRSLLTEKQQPVYDSMVMRMISRSVWSRRPESNQGK